MWIWLCESELNVKTAYFRLPSVSQKRAWLCERDALARVAVRRKEGKSKWARSSRASRARLSPFPPLRTPATKLMTLETQYLGRFDDRATNGIAARTRRSQSRLHAYLFCVLPHGFSRKERLLAVYWKRSPREAKGDTQIHTYTYKRNRYSRNDAGSFQICMVSSAYIK